jgi:hypothetical protein
MNLVGLCKQLKQRGKIVNLGQYGGDRGVGAVFRKGNEEGMPDLVYAVNSGG